MGKILLIMLAVGVIAYVVSLMTGSSSDEATANGCMSAMGCGYSIFQILIYVAIFAALIMFVGWLFS